MAGITCFVKLWPKRTRPIGFYLGTEILIRAAFKHGDMSLATEIAKPDLTLLRPDNQLVWLNGPDLDTTQPGVVFARVTVNVVGKWHAAIRVKEPFLLVEDFTFKVADTAARQLGPEGAWLLTSNGLPLLSPDARPINA
jgi:hypothetical protein